MTDVTTPVLPTKWTDIAEQVRKIVTALNNVLRGKTNNTGEVTLTANDTTTTLSDIRIGIQSVISLQPTTSNAAGALASTYLDDPGDGSVVINHANNAQTDRTFKYIVTG